MSANDTEILSVSNIFFFYPELEQRLIIILFPFWISHELTQATLPSPPSFSLPAGICYRCSRLNTLTQDFISFCGRKAENMQFCLFPLLFFSWAACIIIGLKSIFNDCFSLCCLYYICLLGFFVCSDFNRNLRGQWAASWLQFSHCCKRGRCSSPCQTNRIE